MGIKFPGKEEKERKRMHSFEIRSKLLQRIVFNRSSIFWIYCGHIFIETPLKEEFR